MWACFRKPRPYLCEGLSVLLNYLSREWKMGLTKSVGAVKIGAVLECHTRPVGPGLLMSPGQSWVLQGQRKGQKPLWRPRGSDKGYRAGDRGKEEGKQEEQKKGRLCEVKQSRENWKEMRRRESEGRKNPGAK